MQRITPQRHVASFGHRLQMHAKLVPNSQAQIPEVRESSQHGIDSPIRQAPEASCEVVLLLTSHR